MSCRCKHWTQDMHNRINTGQTPNIGSTDVDGIMIAGMQDTVNIRGTSGIGGARDLRRRVRHRDRGKWRAPMGRNVGGLHKKSSEHHCRCTGKCIHMCINVFRHCAYLLRRFLSLLAFASRQCFSHLCVHSKFPV